MVNQDQQHLKLLSIFHYVSAGITALFACFPIFHLVMGLGMLSGGFDVPPDEEFPIRLFGLMFVLFPAAIILTGWALAASMAAAGYFLSTRQKHTFCLVVAGVECIFVPIGTVLGVFTIIVLVRPSVKAMFEGAASTDAAADSSP